MAHETTHVAQQRQTPLMNFPGESKPLVVSEPSDSSEREADIVADKITAGQSTNIQAIPSATISRTGDEEDSWRTINSLVGNIAGIAGLGNSIAQGYSLAGSSVTGPIGGLTSGLGLLAGGIGMYDAATREGTFGLDDLSDFSSSALSAFSGATGGAGSIASLVAGGNVGWGAYLAAGGSASLAATGGTGFGIGTSLASGGLAAAGGTALSTAGAVAGAGAAGYGIGRLLDEGFGGLMNITGASDLIDGWRGISRPESEDGDYSLSGLHAGNLTVMDRAVTQGLRSIGVFDEERPAYQQTLGWRLAEILPSWLQ